jgi:hypothetical protein
MLISQHRDTGPGRSPAVLHPGAVPARSCAARNSIAWLTRTFASSQGTVVVTSKNASTDQHPQAMGRLSRARFATQSATQFDHALAGAGKPAHDAEPRGTGAGMRTPVVARRIPA